MTETTRRSLTAGWCPSVTDVCELCGEPLDDRDFIIDLEGVGNHVDCLEKAGLWQATPTEGDTTDGED